MPKLYLFGSYIIFFWVGENGEPVHVHVSVKRPSKDSTKIWLTRAGGCLIANNRSDIPERDLQDLREFITYNHADICKRWVDTFGEIGFIR